ncbi:MAG: DUF115 domain-containing protein, partial [Rhodospirillaceae bacterium]|nr:DUF115 domain-containing protein [Rhodospirillaceae bacterium]
MFTASLVPLSRQVGGGAGRIDYLDVMARVHAAMARSTPSLVALKDTQPNGMLIICGGGPSIGDINQLKKIRRLVQKGGKIWAVNKTHDFLLSKGLKPWAACLLDPMPWVADYIMKPQKNTVYAVASQCDAAVFEALKHTNLYVWHAGIDVDGSGYPVAMLENDYKGRDWLVIPGPTTVGLRSILVGYALGFRHFHLFGMDSSMRLTGGQASALHAYVKPKPADAPEGWVTLRTKNGEQSFFTNAHMARQAMDFEEMTEQIATMVKSGA